ncbi:MAG TPA: hypothetical protein VGO40_02430 [Longimicrobium sp.]|jgi:hypothetical protein|nr:hypothetical protein [Longimicrobium sp.]
MRRARSLALLLLALAVPLLHGCSLFRNSTRGETVEVEVNNDLPLRTPLTIYVLSDVGNRQLLGSVAPGSTSRLRFRAAAITGNYRFVARVASQTQGDYLVSNPVALTGGETVSWEIRNNVLLVAR